MPLKKLTETATAWQWEQVGQDRVGLGIPAQLHGQLRESLLACGPFDTDSKLKAIFADDRLTPWRKQLPQAESPIERVERVIDFLYDKYHRTGENAVVLLLQVLSQRLHPNDASHQQLANLAQEAGPATAPTSRGRCLERLSAGQSVARGQPSLPPSPLPRAS